MTTRIKKTIALIGIVILIALFAGSLPVLAEIVQGTHIYLPIVLKAEAPGDIDNPGFEEGQTGWTFYHNYGAQIVTNMLKHSGQNSARLGSDSLNNLNSYISQQVVVPNGQYMLSYWHYIDSQETYCPEFTRYDYVSIQINGDEVDFYDLCDDGSVVNRTWVNYRVNLFGYQGQNVSLKVYYLNDATIVSDFFVDDFTFEYP
ncbi:MAG: hypothetical protein U9R58_08545 [Chloroflexota bacterium]|nr:hypothetical protein [Chloroflexota bacterium]